MVLSVEGRFSSEASTKVDASPCNMSRSRTRAIGAAGANKRVCGECPTHMLILMKGRTRRMFFDRSRVTRHGFCLTTAYSYELNIEAYVEDIPVLDYVLFPLDLESAVFTGGMFGAILQKIARIDNLGLDEAPFHVCMYLAGSL